MTQQLQPKTLLQDGRYQIEQVLGQGGFGITYRATRTDDGQSVAIKELFLQGINERWQNDSHTVVVSNADNSSSFEQQKNKFEKEARRLASLNNEHIVRVHDFFEENDTAYYVMDYVEGRSLSSIMKDGVTEQQAENYLNQLLPALKTIHEQHIWHLDIKPANILVDHAGRLVLIDFGASKHIEQGGHMTTSSALAYTPGFAPPEQLQGTMDNFGPWTDFYALGATIYQVITLQNPPSFADIISEGETAFNFQGAISDKMKGNILWMMKPNRKERPQSVEDFLKGSRQSKSQATSLHEATSQDTVIAMPQEDKPMSRTPLYIVAAVILVAVVAAIIFALNTRVPAESGYAYEEPIYYSEPAEANDYTEAAPAVEYAEPVPAIRRWDGTYTAEHCAGETYGGTAICYTTTIELWSMNDTEEYSGTMTVDGWQTGLRCSISATAFDDNTIKIWVSHSDSDSLSDGDAIARITYNSNGSLSVNWFGPMLEYEFVDGSTSVNKQN